MKPSKILMVFDWDGVIFDTRPLRKVRGKVLKKFGYEEEHILATARSVVETAGGYNFHSHAKALAHGSSHDAEVVAKAIYAAIEKHPGTFVFADARRTIAALKRGKHHFDILTAGHVEFQQYKIMRSGLHSLFRDIHIVRPGPNVPQNKLRILKKLSKSHKVLFLDDRPDTIEMVRRSKALQGKVLPVLVWRKKEKPPHGLEVLKRLSLSGIEKIAIHNGFQPY